MTNPQFAAIVAFFLSLTMVAVKAVLWIFSGSSTVLASLADSIQDTFLSATNYAAIRYAMRPADEDHRYGHGKMEGIAAMAQAAFILGSCVFIILDAIRSVSEPESIQYPMAIIGASLVAIVLNAGLVMYQNMVIKNSNSLAIEADRAHYAGDIGVYLGVIAAVSLDHYFGIRWADPIIAVLIALWLGRMAIGIGKKAMDMLMDRELPDAERDTIKTTIKRTRGVKDFHDLRTHRSGMVTMISMDIEVESSLSFLDAHNIAKRVEDRLHDIYPKSEIMIHVDPTGDIADSRHRKIKKHHVE